MTENEIVRWHHGLNGHDFEQTLRDIGGQERLLWGSPRGCKQSDVPE